MDFEGLAQWRNFFRGSNASIFDIIDKAITLAAIDHPEEFSKRRGEIADKVYSCWVLPCHGHDHNKVIETAKGKCYAYQDRQEGGTLLDLNGNAVDSMPNEGKLRKYASSKNDAEMKTIKISEESYREAEALLDQIDAERQVISEALRIKELIHNCKDESEAALLESLQRLQLMDLPIEILRSTGIEIAVNALQWKCKSAQVTQLAVDLINYWKIMATEMVEVAAIQEHSTPTDSNLSDINEWFRSPPFENLDVFCSLQNPNEISEMFFDETKSNGTKKQCLEEPMVTVIDSTINRPNGENGIRKPQEKTLKQKAKCGSDVRKNNDCVTFSEKLSTKDEKISKDLDEAEMLAKLEGSSKKLQENYRLAAAARKKRAVQLMELHELPKQGQTSRSKPANQKNQGRYRATGRQQRH